MKKLAVLVTLLTAGLHAAWVAPSNRTLILNYGAGAAWEAAQLEEPIVFVDPLDATKLMMFYGGFQNTGGSGQSGIGWATATIAGFTSSPSTAFTRVGTLLTSTGTGFTYIRLDSMIQTGAHTFNLYMTGNDGTSDRIYLSTSTDSGRTFGTPVLALDHTGDPEADESTVSQGAVYWDGASGWYMYYSYRAAAVLPGIRLATSSDGITWSNTGTQIISNGTTGSTDSKYIEWHQIIKVGSEYLLSYEAFCDTCTVGGTTGNWTANLAYSPSPTAASWTKSTSNPLLSASGVGSTFDQYWVATPAFCAIAGQWYLFYQGGANQPSGYYAANWALGVASTGSPLTAITGQSPVLIDGPFLGNITPHNAVASWSTDLSSTSRIICGTSSGSLTDCTNTSQTNQNTAVQSASIQGSPGSTTIYWQACSKPVPGGMQFTITNGGAGYSHAPLVVLSSGPASAVAEVNGGAVTLIVSNWNGTAYTPTVSFTPQGGDTPGTVATAIATPVTNPIEACYPPSPNSYTSGTQSGPEPVDPTPPTPVDIPTIPTQTSGTCGSGIGVCSVGATSHDCNSPSDGLQVQLAAAACGDVIEIDPSVTPYCASNAVYQFPANSCSLAHPLLIRGKNAATIFPGYRMASPADEPKMARIINSAPNIDFTDSGDGMNPAANANCYAGTLYWVQRQTNMPWSMSLCQNSNGVGITAMPTSGQPLNFTTVSNHNFVSGDWGHMSGCGGPAAAMNDDWNITVTGANTVTLTARVYGQGSVSPGGSASGCTLYNERFAAVPYTPVASAPSTCSTPGQWFHKDGPGGSETEYQRTWYGSLNTVSGQCEPMQLRYDFGTNIAYGHNAPPQGPLDLETNIANYVIFQGISFELMNLVSTAQTVQTLQFVPSIGNTGTFTGTTYGSFYSAGSRNNHLSFYNALSAIPDPNPDLSISGSGVAERITGFGGTVDQTHIEGSYFSGYQICGGLSSEESGDDDIDSIIFGQGSSVGAEMFNSYFSGAGILVHYYEANDTLSVISDINVSRSTFDSPNKYWVTGGPLTSQGQNYNAFVCAGRHRFEFKAGHRIRMTGNKFSGGFITSQNAAANCFCTRSNPTLVHEVNNTSVSMYGESPGYGGSWFTSLNPGDYIAFSATSCSTLDHHIYTVATVTPPYAFTLDSAPSLNCDSIGGQIARLNAQTSGITDLLVENNSYFNNPQGFAALGQDSYNGIGTSGIIGAASQRWKINNNLIVGDDGCRIGRASQWYPSAPAPSGNDFQITSGGIEGLQFTHNTAYGRTDTCQGGGSAFFSVGFYNSGTFTQGSALLIRNNIGGYLSGDAIQDPPYYGVAMLNKDWVGSSPTWTWQQNLLTRAGGASSTPYPTTGGNTTLWFDTSSGAFPFYSAAQQNFRIKSTAPYVSGGANRATDGLDLGADIDAIEAAQGNVSNARAHDIGSTSATIGFLAPDANGCTVDWSTNSFTSYTRVTNAGGARVQNVALTGLPSHSLISARANCAAMQPVTSFFTH